MFYSHLAFLFFIGIYAHAEEGGYRSERSTTTHPDTSVQHVTLNFESRSLAGNINVVVQPNNDNITAFGLDLIYPTVPKSKLFEEFHGFPVVKGAITYPIPASSTSGYGSLFGWIQFIKSDTAGEGEGNWTVDSYPYAQDLKDPFGGWGYNPSHFDAPAILLADDGNNEAVVWRAQTYLCVLEDAGVTKNVTVLSGGAFTWGFDLNINPANASERNIVVTKVEALDVQTEWEKRLSLLREQYSEWVFQNFTSETLLDG